MLWPQGLRHSYPSPFPLYVLLSLSVHAFINSGRKAKARSIGEPPGFIWTEKASADPPRLVLLAPWERTFPRQPSGCISVNKNVRKRAIRVRLFVFTPLSAAPVTAVACAKASLSPQTQSSTPNDSSSDL